MSRSDLEQMVMDSIELMTPEELRSTLLFNYEAQTEEQLRESISMGVSQQTRGELEDRARESLQFLAVEHLQPVVREVVEQHLTEADLELLSVSKHPPVHSETHVHKEARVQEEEL
eukprot:gb/GFBE01020461.1/.p1 GENE.gb/GFBE01020461.1/~~gb/GFBE01020461.1/.p1  ORF type:complete len:116 (+),score=37.68 gb/GFBE01020461.1/:1-348(+)